MVGGVIFLGDFCFCFLHLVSFVGGQRGTKPLEDHRVKGHDDVVGALSVLPSWAQPIDTDVVLQGLGPILNYGGPSQMSMGRCLPPRPVAAGGEQGA